jgi:transposase
METRFSDDAFLARFPTHGHPALPPWRLALVTRLPCAEGLSARHAADAVRRRLDWNDGRRLERTAPGGDASVLSACRTRLIAGAAEYLLFETGLSWCRDRHLVTARGRQRTDSTHMLAAVRALNRLEVVGDTRRHALPTLAVVAPGWWRAVRHPAWRDRDTRRAEAARLPTTHAARAALALTMGHEGWRVLAAIDPAAAPFWRRAVPAVAILRRVWRQHDGWDGTPRHGREADHMPPAAPCLSSPAAPAAPDARTHTTPWVGDQVHLTDTCDDDLPPLITNVATAIGPTSDGAAPPRSHDALPPRG